MVPDLLFVYGTLLRGLRDDVLKRVGANFVGTGTIQGRLYDLGRYPGAKTGREFSGHVHGEVLQLPHPEIALAVLDEYEGIVPDPKAKSEFVRKLVRVTLDDCRRRQAWAYLYNRELEETKLIPSGDYRSGIAAGHSSQGGSTVSNRVRAKGSVDAT